MTVKKLQYNIAETLHVSLIYKKIWTNSSLIFSLPKINLVFLRNWWIGAV